MDKLSRLNEQLEASVETLSNAALVMWNILSKQMPHEYAIRIVEVWVDNVMNAARDNNTG